MITKFTVTTKEWKSPEVVGNDSRYASFPQAVTGASVFFIQPLSNAAMALARSFDVGLGATTSTCNFKVSRMNDAVVGPITAILTRRLLYTDSAEELILWN